MRSSRTLIPHRFADGISPILPRDARGCVGWLNMLQTDSYTVTAGAPDTVGSIFNVITDTEITEAVAPPEYEAAGLQGKPCLKGLTASSRQLISGESAVVAPFIGSGVQASIIAVMEHSNTAGWCVVFANSGVAGSRTTAISTDTNLPRWRASKQLDTAIVSIGTSSCPSYGAQVVAAVFDGSVARILVNGRAHDVPFQMRLGQVTPDRYGLFCRPDSVPDNFWSGRIGEVAFLNHADIRTVIGVSRSMMGRWGLG